MKKIALIALLFLPWISVNAEITGKEVSYKVDGVSMKGYVAYDTSSKKQRPGVVVVHEWWGHNEYARKRARMLAELGYAAIALDMYGDGKQAAHPKEAGQFSSAIRKNLPLATKRFSKAVDVLKALPVTDGKHISAVGYCFGGAIVLEMARSGLDLDGIVSVHGSLGTSQPASKGKVKARVLVLNGADDPFTKPEQIAAFKKEMETAGVDYKFVNYEGAKHAFSNPAADENGKKFNIPLAYNKKADMESWEEMKKFLVRVSGGN